MEKDKLILVINPGSTSTKIAVFKNDTCIEASNLFHSTEEIKKASTIYGQKDMRTKGILNWIKSIKMSVNDLDAVVGRGGLLRPMPGGTYKITQKMLENLKIGFQGQHAANLGGIIAYDIGSKIGVPSFIVDPVAVDEFEEVARISGLPEIQRRSLVHALNINAVVRKVSTKINKKFREASYVVAHIGGGISVAPVKNGRIIDVNNASEEGPFSAQRCGSVPADDIVCMSYSGKYTYEEMRRKVMYGSGLTAYLGTNDGRVIEKRIDEGDKKAELIFKSMAYQIGKEIGGMAAVLGGKVDAVILTGGFAYSKRITDWICDMVSFIAPVHIVPGEDEMLALAEGALRVLNNKEEFKIYEDEVFRR